MDVLVGVFVARQKEQMKVKNGGKLVDERYLLWVQILTWKPVGEDINMKTGRCRY